MWSVRQCLFRVLALVLLASSGCLCFTTSRRVWPNAFQHSTTILPMKSSRNDEESSTSSRRLFFQSGFSVLSTMIALPQCAHAKDEIFKANPLTNPVLEQMRIWEQAEADELKYGGELAMGNEGNRGKVEIYTQLLVPILQVASELNQVNTFVLEGNWKQAQSILNEPKYEKLAFKKTFNKFGDNIYYSDPDRANLYLGGGATPRNEQSLAYLLRNDILTNVESLRVEVNYLLMDSTSEEEKNDTADLFLYSKTCVNAMERYLDLVPPKEIQAAREIMEKTAT